MIRSVTRKVDGRGSQIADVKCFVIIKELAKRSLIFLCWNSISLAEQFLHLLYALANADWWSATLLLSKPILKIRCCGQVICMSMRFEDPVHLVTLLPDKRD